MRFTYHDDYEEKESKVESEMTGNQEVEGIFVNNLLFVRVSIECCDERILNRLEY
jgi:hypothetical protein